MMETMAHLPFIWLVLGGFVLEGLIAYPALMFKWIGHPVSWMGALIAMADRKTNSAGKRPVRDVIAGFLLVGLGGVALFSAAWQVSHALDVLPYGWVLELCFVASLLAARSLYNHVAVVRTALMEDGVPAGRVAVSSIVGRNVDQLDERGIARAAVESLAESSSDGVVAPLFWVLVAGLPGLVLYKFVNTADSLIGHHSDRYEQFGKTAARLDDMMNWIPARLTGMLFGLAAWPMGRAGAALRVMWCDARLHASPNAGWPEAAMAGALNLRLGGPRCYGAVSENAAWLGAGRAALDGTDIQTALDLYRRLLFIVMVCLLGVALTVGEYA